MKTYSKVTNKQTQHRNTISFNRKHRSTRPQNVRPQSFNRKSASTSTALSSSRGRVTLMLLSGPVTTEGDMSLVSLFSLAQKMFKSILLTTRCPICTSSVQRRVHLVRFSTQYFAFSLDAVLGSAAHLTLDSRSSRVTRTSRQQWKQLNEEVDAVTADCAW